MIKTYKMSPLICEHVIRRAVATIWVILAISILTLSNSSHAAECPEYELAISTIKEGRLAGTIKKEQSLNKNESILKLPGANVCVVDESTGGLTCATLFEGEDGAANGNRLVDGAIDKLHACFPNLKELVDPDARWITKKENGHERVDLHPIMYRNPDDSHFWFRQSYISSTGNANPLDPNANVDSVEVHFGVTALASNEGSESASNRDSLDCKTYQHALDAGAHRNIISLAKHDGDRGIIGMLNEPFGIKEPKITLPGFRSCEIKRSEDDDGTYELTCLKLFDMGTKTIEDAELKASDFVNAQANKLQQCFPKLRFDKRRDEVIRNKRTVIYSTYRAWYKIDDTRKALMYFGVSARNKGDSRTRAMVRLSIIEF